MYLVTAVLKMVEKENMIKLNSDTLIVQSSNNTRQLVSVEEVVCGLFPEQLPKPRVLRNVIGLVTHHFSKDVDRGVVDVDEVNLVVGDLLEKFDYEVVRY